MVNNITYFKKSKNENQNILLDLANCSKSFYKNMEKMINLVNISNGVKTEPSHCMMKSELGFWE